MAKETAEHFTAHSTAVAPLRQGVSVANQPEGGPEGALAEQAKGRKSLAQSHLEEMIAKRGERKAQIEALMPKDDAAKLLKDQPQIAPGTPLTPAQQQEQLETQALRMQLARARNLTQIRTEEPPLRTYEVVHNNSEHTVKAKDALEAWAKCCDEKHQWPSPKTALVTEIEGKNGGPKPALAVAEHGTSPVEDETAEDAKAVIANMRSAVKLQRIIDHDSRTSVKKAAQERLDEINKA